MLTFAVCICIPGGGIVHHAAAIIHHKKGQGHEIRMYLILPAGRVFNAASPLAQVPLRQAGEGEVAPVEEH
jgi:hypothetical protein